MKASLYIIINRNGIDRTAKTTNFTLAPGEKAFRLDVEVPPEVFAPTHIPTVTLQINADALMSHVVAEARTPERTDP